MAASKHTEASKSVPKSTGSGRSAIKRSTPKRPAASGDAEEGDTATAAILAEAKEEADFFDFKPLSHAQRIAADRAAVLLRTYLATRNGVHFWRAWLARRDASLEPTDAMLAKIDQVARRLVRAASAKALGDAVEMNGSSTSLETAQARDQKIMVEIWKLACKASGEIPKRNVRPRVPDDVMGRVASSAGLKIGALKVRWSRWWKDTESANRGFSELSRQRTKR